MQPSFSPLAGDQIEKMHFQSWDWWASLVVCEVFCKLLKIPNTLLHLVHLNFCSCWASGLVWKIWERSSKEWESDNQIYSPGDLIVECPHHTSHVTRDHVWHVWTEELASRCCSSSVRTYWLVLWSGYWSHQTQLRTWRLLRCFCVFFFVLCYEWH